MFGGDQDWREEGYLEKARMRQDRLAQAGRAKLEKNKGDKTASKNWFGQPKSTIIAIVVAVWIIAIAVTAVINGGDNLQDRSNGITRETALDFCRGDKAEKTSDGWRVEVPQENTICLVKRESDGRIKWERWPLDGDFKNYQPPR